MKTHTISFRKKFYCDMKPTKSDRLERLRVVEGDVMQCQVVCRVVDFREVANIFFTDGMLIDVPCAIFQFVDSDKDTI